MSIPITVNFEYSKPKVIQALRYHFLTRPEIRIMLILVNVFALFSAALFYFGKIRPFAFLISTTLWIFLFISFWYMLPGIVYRRASTFKDHFTMQFSDAEFSIGNERGSRGWPWSALTDYRESPHFFHLYFDARSFFLVPKTDYMESDQVLALRELLKTKVKKK
jgi:signal transduction histidine kinase